MVSEGGLEPPRPCGHQPLKLARLPIPPLRRDCKLKAASGDRSAAPSAHLSCSNHPTAARPARRTSLLLPRQRGRGVVGRLGLPDRPQLGVPQNGGAERHGRHPTDGPAPGERRRLGVDRQGHHLVPELCIGLCVVTSSGVRGELLRGRLTRWSNWVFENLVQSSLPFLPGGPRASCTTPASGSCRARTSPAAVPGRRSRRPAPAPSFAPASGYIVVSSPAATSSSRMTGAASDPHGSLESYTMWSWKGAPKA